MHNLQLGRNNGFTLLELMIAVVVGSVVVLALVGGFHNTAANLDTYIRAGSGTESSECYRAYVWIENVLLFANRVTVDGDSFGFLARLDRTLDSNGNWTPNWSILDTTDDTFVYIRQTDDGRLYYTTNVGSAPAAPAADCTPATCSAVSDQTATGVAFAMTNSNSWGADQEVQVAFTMGSGVSTSIQTVVKPWEIYV